MNTEIATRQNGIAKAQKPLAPNLTEKENKIVIASRSPHCSKLLRQGDPEVNFILTKALRSQHTIAGYSKPEKEDPKLVNEIVVGMMEVVKLHSWLRVKELERIINQGLIGEFGDFYGLNARVLNGWIKTYFEAERAAAIKKQAAFEAAQKEEAEKARELENMKRFTVQQRERLIENYRKLQETNKELISQKALTYRHIPKDIDLVNVWFRKFWNAGIHRIDDATRNCYVSEEEKKLRHTKLSIPLDKEQLKERAKSSARSRVFREKIASLLNEGADIEEVLKEVGL